MSGSPVALLDVNVLLALHLPHHIHHAAAHRWFSALPNRRWATCGLTQAGFLRLSLNPRITGQKLDFGAALAALKQATRVEGHEFWEGMPAASESDSLGASLVQGHQQVTDAYLLAVAQHHNGRLATFDAGVATLLPRPSQRQRWVEVILA